MSSSMTNDIISRGFREYDTRYHRALRTRLELPEGTPEEVVAKLAGMPTEEAIKVAAETYNDLVLRSNYLEEFKAAKDREDKNPVR